jgi:hypothetical protein
MKDSSAERNGMRLFNRRTQASALQHVHSERAETFATHLVARESLLLDQVHRPPVARKKKGCDGTCGAGADDQRGSREVDWGSHGHDSTELVEV